MEGWQSELGRCLHHHTQNTAALIEQGFGWAKFIGPIRQVMVRGIKNVDQVFMMAMAAYNLVRMRTLGQVRLEVA